tara:strand:+ start:346 stop:549 length:204 start_codon:yes stop_codon:yes gene_type:complete
MRFKEQYAHGLDDAVAVLHRHSVRVGLMSDAALPLMAVWEDIQSLYPTEEESSVEVCPGVNSQWLFV